MAVDKTAVILFNLGGPDTQEAVRPFLFNLFRDKAIISAPAPVRYPLAALIALTRAKSAKANYQLMGGGSPILQQTQAQAQALETALETLCPGEEIRCFIAMRYWHPFVKDTVREVKSWNPDRIVLLPLYPQFSTTTSDSSLKSWEKAFDGRAVTASICCYPDLPGVAESHATAIKAILNARDGTTPVRILFSAHGLPERTIAAGDPYVEQVQATVEAIVRLLDPGLDYQVCFQSRVGPLKWVGPSTAEEIVRAGEEGLGVIICPVAFVSEHVETLVELDIEYRELADHSGCPSFDRSATPSTDPAFIGGLAELVQKALTQLDSPCGTMFRCSAAHGKCPRRCK